MSCMRKIKTSIGSKILDLYAYSDRPGSQRYHQTHDPNHRSNEKHNAAGHDSAASPTLFNLDSVALLASSFYTRPLSLARERESRRDKHFHSTLWPLRFYDLRQTLTGTVSLSPLPLFPYNMAFRGKPFIPATPRVISPSPTPSETQDETSQDSYLGPVTRSAARRRQAGSVAPQLSLYESIDEESDPELRRARTRSRSPIKSRKVGGLTSARSGRTPKSKPKEKNEVKVKEEETSNGHLAPPTPGYAPTLAGWDWRDFSRSPSPLGLIPIHRHFKKFIHKHEVPRKVLHVSIGFLVYWLYVSGTQTSSVTPFLMGALIPIATTDYLRHKYASLNRFYVRCLGALMRESEYAGWNGVVFYLLGAWTVLYFFPKDIAVVAVMLLSWCDTAASTFGRLYGRYTPRLRRGKSLAGSLAAFIVGVATAGWFWGLLAPKTGPFPGDEQHPFMFQGLLRLPEFAANAFGLSEAQSVVDGPVALGLLSLWSGFVAAGSEVIDLFGWDDNLTIPILSGIGIWGFLKVFG
ncbi:hypothetical protein F4781DRAFT_422659 [Annulohypoxylon bovei var. microspora]|nr:hypothetical protein F4781DRAFT_422659 [Annulohypoxylon bovei var. microspora]